MILCYLEGWGSPLFKADSFKSSSLVGGGKQVADGQGQRLLRGFSVLKAASWGEWPGLR